MSKPNRAKIDDAILKRFADGRLNSAAEVKVAVAIENSPELQARMAAISSDGFLERVKQIATASRLSKAGSQSRTTKVAADDPVFPSSVAGIPQELVDSKDYQVLKELGRGGMGVVYAAKYLPMDRMEVLKVLNERMVEKDAAKQRFISEMKAIGKLNHPFIATAYQRVVLPTQLVFSMEYVPGIDLHKFVQKYQPVPIPVACALADQIATALQHAHARKTVHRDIKPSNVMVFKDDGKLQIKILDFGLAKATSEQQTEGLTADGTMLGTPEYMAPEQALDAATADIRADIYSLGCTLYHLLTGKPPFSGTYQSVLMAHAQKEATLVSLSRLDVPVELSEVVAKMMAKAPANRYQTPKAVSDSLKPFIGTGRLKRTGDDPAAKSDTLLSLASPSRDTSVETAAKPIAPQEEKQQETPIDVSVRLASLETVPRFQSNLKRHVKSRTRRRASPRIAQTAIGSLILALMLYAGALMVKTKEGTLVLENLPPNAAVIIDGEQVTISDPKGNGPTEISIAPGTRQIEVKANGVVVLGETVSIDAGERVPLQAKMLARDANEPNSAEASSERNSSKTRAASKASLPNNGEWVDLLELIDLDKHTPYGKWKRDGSSIVPTRFEKVGHHLHYAVICPPIELGTTYAIEFEVERLSRNNIIILGITIGGKPCVISFDNGSSSHIFADVGESPVFKEKVFHNNDPKTVRVVAESDSIKVSVPSGPILEWRGDPNNLVSIAPELKFFIAMSDGGSSRLKSFRYKELTEGTN